MSSRLLRKGLKLSHLRLMAALAETGRIGEAADRVTITRPAASRLMSEIERIAGYPMHMRTGRGVTLTPEGQALARRAARVLLEIDSAGRELDEMGEGRGGQVRVGAVTGAVLERVLPAIRATPDLSIRVEAGPSDVLADQLLAGELDFAVARLSDAHDHALFDIQMLGGEQIAMLAHRDHPLAEQEVGINEFLNHPWVMPHSDAILRQTVEARLRQLGLPVPMVPVATSSFLLTLTLLRQTRSIAPVGRSVAVEYALGDMPFIALRDPFEFEVAPYGFVTRSGAILTRAAERFKGIIQSQA